LLVIFIIYQYSSAETQFEHLWIGNQSSICAENMYCLEQYNFRDKKKKGGV
jgi:hypothetical protein